MVIMQADSEKLLINKLEPNINKIFTIYTWTDLVTLALTTWIFSNKGAMAETLDLDLHTSRLCQESLLSQPHTPQIDLQKDSTV